MLFFRIITFIFYQQIFWQQNQKKSITFSNYEPKWKTSSIFCRQSTSSPVYFNSFLFREFQMRESNMFFNSYISHHCKWIQLLFYHNLITKNKKVFNDFKMNFFWFIIIIMIMLASIILYIYDHDMLLTNIHKIMFPIFALLHPS